MGRLMHRTHDLNVVKISRLATPRDVKAKLPLSDRGSATVAQARADIARIIRREDPRLLVVVGPCSLHDEKAAYEYAGRLNGLRAEFGDRIFLLMRAYFHKPRTVVGWKGMLNDPYLNGTPDVQAGLLKSRAVLLHLAEIGVPSATEVLDPVVPQYIDDLVCWASIGARTTESQTHREMASGLSMPIGFKNSTDGNNQVAIDALQSARHPHHFLGIDLDGCVGVVETRGNDVGHIILRGGRDKPNYDEASIAETVQQLQDAGLHEAVMVDCSHANSQKRFELQPAVFEDVLRQRVAGNDAIVGMMLESNLVEGSQKIPADLSQLAYGVSVTDACIGWDTTERLLRDAYDALANCVAAA